jgi:hypothetical protein
LGGFKENRKIKKKISFSSGFIDSESEDKMFSCLYFHAFMSSWNALSSSATLRAKKEGEA